MENLLFSLNIVLPIFLLAVLGFILKKINILNEEFSSAAMSLVYYVALPCSLFLSVAQTDIYSGFNIRFILYAFGASFAVYLLTWLLAVLFVKDRGQISAIVHGAFRGNFAYIGLAMCRNMLDTDNLVAAVLIIAFVVPIYNVMAVIVLSCYNTAGEKASIGKIALGVIKNPLTIGILLALPLSLMRIPLPTAAQKTLNYLSQLATPLALIIIGSNLKTETFRKKPAGILIASVMKVIVAPVFGTAGALLLGFRGEELVTLFVMLAVPAAANSYIMTKKLGGDGEVGSGIVMVTTVVSVFTLTIGTYIFKTMGWL